MAGISIKIDSRATQAALKAVQRQMPQAMAGAVNDVAFQIQRAERSAMSTVFKNPRPFTARSVMATQATKANPTATVYVRPEVARYLKPYEQGGDHVLPGSGLVSFDPIGARTDQYGQLPRGSIARLTAQPNIFAGPIKAKDGTVINGIWERLDITRTGKVRRKRRGRGTIYDAQHGALKLLVLFGNALPVKQRLDFVARGESVANTAMEAAFARALAKAMATAK
jgi:hypothetical protein